MTDSLTTPIAPSSQSTARLRSREHQEEFSSFAERVRSNVPLPGDLSKPFDSRFFRLDKAVGKMRPNPQAVFRYQQVESLLDQTADLLERALQDRATYSYKAAQALLLRLELEQFFQMDLVHQQEVAAGVYELVMRLLNNSDICVLA
jgi:hypothetical protein